MATAKKATKTGSRSIDDQIAEKEEEIKKLKAEQDELRNPKQEYPKFIPDPSNPHKGRIVTSADEEKGVASGKDQGHQVPVSAELRSLETKAAEALFVNDAEAAGAHGSPHRNGPGDRVIVLHVDDEGRAVRAEKAPKSGKSEKAAKPAKAPKAAKGEKAKAAKGKK